MATYAIGDVQGCYRELRALLDLIGFDRRRDGLWFTGDLVNRGPDSLSVLRYVRDLGERAVVVLGNHDLHLLACAAGTREPHRRDTLHSVLSASDRNDLMGWIRGWPLLHHDEMSGYTLVHAGLPPQWDLQQARNGAAEVQAVLNSEQCDAFFRHMYGDQPDQWQQSLRGWDRLRFITNCFTRLRFCTREGRLALKEKGPPGSQGRGLLPWFQVGGRKSANLKVIFGHWATLALTPADSERFRVFGLDSGCIWGGRLTAMRLEDAFKFEVPCQAPVTGAD